MLHISVVIPTYKRPELLKKCLLSLANQILPKQKYEIIVVSDGLDQFTNKLIETLNLKINLRYYHLKAHQGPAAARNFGWQKAKADLIAFTDDDCLPTPYWLSETVNFFKADAAVATGPVIVPIRNSTTDFALNTKNLETAEFVTANCFIKKKVLENIGGFDERFLMAFREDSDIQFRLIKSGITIKNIPPAIVIHPVRNSTWWVSLQEQKKALFNALLFKKHPQLYRSKIQTGPPWHYYLIILSLGLALFFSFFLLVWVLLTAVLVYQRVRHTSYSLTHFLSILITTIFIPFLSIFWRIYGAIKFRVLFF